MHLARSSSGQNRPMIRPARTGRLPAFLAIGGLGIAVVWMVFVISAASAPYVPLSATGTIGRAPLVGGWVLIGRLSNSILPDRRPATLLMFGVSAAAHVAAAEIVVGLPASVLLPHPALCAACAVVAGRLPLMLFGHSPALRHAVASMCAAAVIVVAASPAHAWIAGARLKTPTATQIRTHGVDLVIDTHQWIANQAVEILAGDGRADIVALLDAQDPTAPEALDPATGVPMGRRETYRWRLLLGARDADGVLYRQIPDHFFNFWTHHGRSWILGGSAAIGAEKAFATAARAWRSGDQSTAIYWLGAAIHLVTDACVPQHQFFAVNPYHHQYELWVQQHQPQLAVNSGGIYQDQFRVNEGHGGEAWSSTHPRGWVDECAHRAVQQLRAASHPNTSVDQPNDPRLLTTGHIADTQRLAAGFIAFFFDEVNR